MKKINFNDKITLNFETNLSGFIQAVSFKESSSDLSKGLNHPDNVRASKEVNPAGYLGLFQWGESALYELGYYLGDKGISYEDIKNVKKESALYKNWKSQFSSNNWSGRWSGKRNINSKSDFLNNPQSQYEIIKEWINYLCKQIRNNNLNEHFGRTIQGVEITESGAIAGMHLVGIGGLGAFLGISSFSGNKQTDGNGTHIKKYIQDFGGFDLENCCNRKIYIHLKDKNENSLVNKEVIIISKYSGKNFSGETKIKVKSDENGNLPVIVRHPNTEIRIAADGKESNPIIQKADQKQRAILQDFEVSKFPATLEENSTPQPKPQLTKTPQEVRNEQNSIEMKNKLVTQTAKDVNFNIQIVEEDTGKAISNMSFYLTYKGNIKKHTADNKGINRDIVAELGQDIEVSVSGEGKNQKIHTFKVEERLNNQTLKVKLSVCSFKINVKQNNKNVTNLSVNLFYRGKQISKRTDNNGNINVKMLTGFVYGFGLKNRELEKVRVIKGLSVRNFSVNEGFVRASKLYEIADQKRKEVDELKKKSDEANQKQQEAQDRKAKEQVDKAKSESEKNQPIQNNTHTENGGRPLTTVSNQGPVTSDTTRYHIYPDGKIKRENKAATGYAEFIYYEANGTAHNLGKSKFIVAPKRKNGNMEAGGNVYLIDQRKHTSYSKGNISYKWTIISENKRYYLNGVTMSAVLGALIHYGNEEFIGSGFSTIDAKSAGGSKSHINGEAGDFRYLGKDGKHKTGPVETSFASFDMDANTKLVKAFKRFGFGTFLTGTKAKNGIAKVPGTTYWDDHHHHLHIGKHKYNVEDI